MTFHDTEGGMTVDTGTRSCTAQACNQGRKPCPCPDACQIAADDELELFSDLWSAIAVFALVCVFCASAAFAVGYWTGL